jgi:hypothetical protein
MRKIIVSEFVTLDGVREDLAGAEKFKHGGLTCPCWNEEIRKFKFDELFSIDALLRGQLAYQGFEASWPSGGDEQGFADGMNSLPKIVVSTTLKEVTWSNSRLIAGNIGEECVHCKAGTF